MRTGRENLGVGRAVLLVSIRSLIDSGAGIGDNVLFFVGVAQEIVLVVTPEPTSLVDA